MKVMKSCILVLTLLMALPLVAQTLGDKINDLQNQLNAATDKRPGFESREKALDAKKDDIIFVYNAYKKQSAILQQSFDEWQQKANAHNATQCTEQCDQNGHCDGSCGWYTAEKTRLEGEYGQLKTNAGLLNEIQARVSSDTEQWTADAKALIAEAGENEALIAQLQQQLADLRAQQVDCLKSIPKECDNPYTTALVTKCERMHAACGRMFDGN